MVPMTTRSQPAAFSLVTWALKSWSVGLWVTVSTHLQLELLGLHLHAVEHLLAEVGVLVHRAEGLLALLAHEVLDARAHLVHVAGRPVELQLVEGLVHRARGGEREEVRHPRVELVLEQRVVHRGAEARHHREDVVAVDQLGPRLHRAGHLVLGVLDHEPDLAALDAARLVDLVEAHLHRVRGGDPVGGGGAREVGVHAEHDLGLGDPAGVLLGRGHPGQGHRGGHGHDRQ